LLENFLLSLILKGGERYSASSEEGEAKNWPAEGPGLTPLIKHSPWSVSDKSLDSSFGSGKMREKMRRECVGIIRN
jgi:hypothetical protein